jgi:hypothetical protein
MGGADMAASTTLAANAADGSVLPAVITQHALTSLKYAKALLRLQGANLAAKSAALRPLYCFLWLFAGGMLPCKLATTAFFKNCI